MSTTLDADADVDALELVLACDEYGLVDLEAEDFGLEEVDGRAVDLDQALPFPCMGNGRGSLLYCLAKNNGRGCGL